MNQHVRAAMAATAISHHTGRRISSIFDVCGNIYRSIGVAVSNQRVTGYNFELSCHFNGKVPYLYHYGGRCNLDLKPTGEAIYDGFDHHSNLPFMIKVNSIGAELYDGEEDVSY